MKNLVEFPASENHAIVWLERRDGTRWGCKIDHDSVFLIKGFDAWYAQWDDDSQTFYAVGRRKEDDKTVSVLMHRLITEAPPDKEVDHQNHQGLDNRRENLLVCPRIVNALNRKGANRNSATNERGVYFHPKTGKFRAWIWIDGKRKELSGGFDTPAEAAAARKLAEASHAADAINVPSSEVA